MRTGGAFAYDEGRQRLVIHGGVDTAGTILGDTWEWDGTTWMQAQPGGTPPGPRAAAQLVYDRDRGRLVLLGGATTTALTDDVFEYDGATWYAGAIQNP